MIIPHHLLAPAGWNETDSGLSVVQYFDDLTVGDLFFDFRPMRFHFANGDGFHSRKNSIKVTKCKTIFGRLEYGRNLRICLRNKKTARGLATRGRWDFRETLLGFFEGGLGGCEACHGDAER